MALETKLLHPLATDEVYQRDVAVGGHHGLGLRSAHGTLDDGAYILAGIAVLLQLPGSLGGIEVFLGKPEQERIVALGLVVGHNRCLILRAMGLAAVLEQLQADVIGIEKRQQRIGRLTAGLIEGLQVTVHVVARQTEDGLALLRQVVVHAQIVVTLCQLLTADGQAGILQGVRPIFHIKVHAGEHAVDGLQRTVVAVGGYVVGHQLGGLRQVCQHLVVHLLDSSSRRCVVGSRRAQQDGHA